MAHSPLTFEWKSSLTPEQLAALDKPGEASANRSNPFMLDNIKEESDELESPAGICSCVQQFFSAIFNCFRSIFCCFKKSSGSEEAELVDIGIDNEFFAAGVEVEEEYLPISAMTFDNPIPSYSAEDQRRAGLLLDFYQNDKRCMPGYTLEGLTQPNVKDFESKGWIEKRHDYIQWLFPSPYETELGARDTSPRLNRAFVEAFQASRTMQYNFDRALRMMMLFYGLHIDLKANTVMRAGGNEKALAPKHNWLTENNHNFPRLSRILTSMKYLNYRPELRIALYNMLCDIAEKEGKGIISPLTLGHWDRACNYPPRELV